MSSIFRLWPQILMAVLCNIAVLSFGLQTTWVSALQPAFQSDHSPLGLPALTDDEISWIAALPNITMVLCTPLFGWTMDRFGRKITLVLTTAPNLITYLILHFANNINLVYCSRLLGGFCSSGAFVVGPIYSAECAEPKLKGGLSGITGFFVKLGMILSYLLGPYVPYTILNIFSASFTIFFIALYFWIPESPAYLIKHEKIDQAEVNLRKLWGPQSEELIKREITVIRNNLDDSKFSKWKILKNIVMDKRLRMGCFISGSIFSFQMLSGYPAVIRYTVDIISDAGADFSPYLAAITLGVSQLVFSFSGSFLLEKVGRKRLAVFCLLGMASCMAVLSTFLFLKAGSPDSKIISILSPLPVVTLVLFVALYGTGYGTVPFVMIPVLFSPDVRATASTLLNFWFAFVEFVVVKTFYSIRNWIDLPGALAVFAVTGYTGTLILFKIMFKTEGLNFEEIQAKLAGRKPQRTESKAEQALLQT